MNPVDHPHGGVSTRRLGSGGGCWKARYLTQHHYRVTINTSARPRPSRGSLLRVRRRVLLLRGGRVCCVVPRRRRSKGFHGSTLGARGSSDCIGLLLLCSYGTAKADGKTCSFLQATHGRDEMNKRIPNAVGTGATVDGGYMPKNPGPRGAAGQAERSGGFTLEEWTSQKAENRLLPWRCDQQVNGIGS